MHTCNMYIMYVSISMYYIWCRDALALRSNPLIVCSSLFSSSTHRQNRTTKYIFHLAHIKRDTITSILTRYNLNLKRRIDTGTLHTIFGVDFLLLFVAHRDRELVWIADTSGGIKRDSCCFCSLSPRIICLRLMCLLYPRTNNKHANPREPFTFAKLLFGNMYFFISISNSRSYQWHPIRVTYYFLSSQHCTQFGKKRANKVLASRPKIRSFVTSATTKNIVFPSILPHPSSIVDGQTDAGSRCERRPSNWIEWPPPPHFRWRAGYKKFHNSRFNWDPSNISLFQFFPF